MIRARSPLFYPTVLTVFLSAVAYFDWRATFGSSQYGLAWKTDPATIYQVRSVAVPLLLTFAALALILVGIQVAVKSGWEPLFLQRTILGAVVVQKEKTAHGGWIVVAVPDQIPMRFEADPNEFAGIKEGDVAHIRVIGQFVASYRIIQDETADRLRAGVMEPKALKSWRDAGMLQKSVHGGFGWVYMMLMPIISAYFVSEANLAFAFKEAVSGGTSRYSSHFLVTGTTAIVQGFISLAYGIATLGFFLVLWAKGWDSDTFRSRYRRSGWNTGLPDDYV